MSVHLPGGGASAVGVATPPRGRRYGLARQHQEQHRALRGQFIREQRLAGVARIAFFVASGTFFAWASPFLPRGLDPNTYAGPAALAVAFACMAVLFWAASMMLSFRARGRRRVIAPWATLFDDSTGIYNRAYFVDTLETELSRAVTRDASVAVYVIEVERQTPRGDLERLAPAETDVLVSALNTLLGSDDTLATVRPGEFAALIPDADRTTVQASTLGEGLRAAFGKLRGLAAYRIRIGRALGGRDHDARNMLDRARADLRSSRVVMAKRD